MLNLKSTSCLVFLAILVNKAESQNTIPTTTCTGAFKVNDSLSVSKNITAAGDITTNGEVISKDTLRAEKDIIVEGNAKILGDLSIAGKSIFNQDVKVNKSILLDNGNEFSFSPATTNTPPTFYLGQSTYKLLPFVECPNPSTSALPQFVNNGKFISRVPLGTGSGQTNSALSFFSAPWNGTGIIEVDGVDNNGGSDNGLMINYFCGRNTYINVNNGLSNGGGIVYMGTKVAMANSARIGWDGNNPIDVNSNLSIHTASGNAIKFVTWNNSAKMLTIVNGNYTKSPFTVYGDGKTIIGLQNVVGMHADALLQVAGKIASKSFYVLKPTTWADYVFTSNYKLTELSAEESYIKKNGHLKGIPSENEVMENGYDLNEMDAKLLAKLEESYLHIIELHKKISNLEGEIMRIKSNKKD